MPEPRTFVIRHGETEWSISGQHTSATDLSLTENGKKRLKATSQAMIGDDRLIVPKRIKRIYVSPRLRAQQTLDILLESHPDIRANAEIITTEEIREWDYGLYEGKTTKEIKELRKKHGLDKDGHKWFIWTDGCEGGESPVDVTSRVDRLINEIKQFQNIGLERERKGLNDTEHDVMVIAHGHILRTFAFRWVNKTVEDNPALLLEAGGIGTLSYEHQNVEEPAIVLGSAFIVPNDYGHQ